MHLHFQAYFLTVGELASHNHTGSATSASLTGSATQNTGQFDSASGIITLSNSQVHIDSGVGGGGYRTINVNASHGHTVSINNTGSGQVHNNQQPYISCYIWHRTAQPAVGELPSHTHSASSNNTGAHTHTFGYPRGDSTYSNGNGNQWWGPKDTATKTTNSAGNHTHSISVNNAGGNEAHLNVQPYITCYIWQRTAQAVLRQIYTEIYG